MIKNKKNLLAKKNTLLLFVTLILLILAVFVVINKGFNFNINEFARGDECGYIGAPKCPSGQKCSRGFCENIVTDKPRGEEKKCQSNQECRERADGSGRNYCNNKGKCVLISGNNTDQVCGGPYDTSCPKGTKCKAERVGVGSGNNGRWYCYECGGPNCGDRE